MMQCLTEIVGVTQSDCQCIVQGLNTEQLQKLRASKSGLFMDDLPGGVHMRALQRVDACKSFYEFSIGARDNAIKTVENDIIIALNNQYKKDKPNFIGQIGRMSYAGSLGVSKDWQGMQITPHSTGDGVITLNRLFLVLNDAATVAVKIYRVIVGSVMGEQIYSYPVTTTANNFTQVDIGATPVKLPLTYNGEAVEYYFTYDLSGAPGVQPKDTGINCSTCNGGIQPFSDYVTARGVQLNDTNYLNEKITDAFSHGLILDVEIRCDGEQLICREYSADDAVAIILGYSVQFKAGELLIEEVLKQPDVTRYTMMDKERLWGKRNHFRAEYEWRLKYLSTSINVWDSNCYVCNKQVNQPFIGGILS
jgi:hypothetical protein